VYISVGICVFPTIAVVQPQFVTWGARRTPLPHVAPTGSDSSICDQTDSRASGSYCAGQPTCRSGIDVFGTMDGRVDMVLDGGFCTGGGATTVDVTEPDWRVVKAGTIHEREIAEGLAGT